MDSEHQAEFTAELAQMKLQILAASAAGEALDVPEGCNTYSIAHETLMDDGLLAYDRELLTPMITAAGRHLLGRAGDVPSAAVAFLPKSLADINARCAVRDALIGLTDEIETAVAAGSGADFITRTLCPKGAPSVDDRAAVRFVGAAHALSLRCYLSGLEGSDMQEVGTEAEGVIMAAAILRAWDALSAQEDVLGVDGLAMALLDLESNFDLLPAAGMAVLVERFGEDRLRQMHERHQQFGVWGTPVGAPMGAWFDAVDPCAPPLGGVTPRAHW